MMKSILNAELYELMKTSKTDLYTIPKEDMHSDSHLIFDRTQLSLCNCPINLTKRQKVYKWFCSIVMFKQFRSKIII